MSGRLSVLAAVAAASVATGCGGGEENSADDEYPHKAGLICAELGKKVGALDFVAEAEYTRGEEGDPEAIAKLEDGFSKYVPIQEAALEEFRSLRPPQQDTQAAEEFLLAVERLVATGRDDLAALRTRKLDGFLSRRMPERHFEADGRRAGGIAPWVRVRSSPCASALTRSAHYR